MGVQFRLDGANLGAEDTTSPYSVSWNTTTVANGSHTLTAVARDAPGLTTTSTAVTVTVSNAAPPVGLVLAFNFEETGATVADRSGQGNNGTVSGATSITTVGYRQSQELRRNERHDPGPDSAPPRPPRRR